jgi:acetyl esterase/lipase
MKNIAKIIGVIIVIIILGRVANSIKNKDSNVKGIVNDQFQQSNSSGTISSEPTKKDLVLRDVRYGDNKRNTMNVLIPKGSNNTTPFILFIHGGAWISGDKKDVAFIQSALSKSGIASASINYRYASNSIHYPELMNDVDTAVHYIVDHGKDWNIDTEKITIGGASAGAHMALLYGYRYDKGNRIGSIISMSGPTDITQVNFLDGATSLKLIDGVNKMVGENYEFGKPVPSQFKDASPIQYVKNIPTLLIHGTKDSVVPYAQSESLSNVLKQKGYTHDLLTINGVNHDLGMKNQANVKQVTNRVVEWVKMYNK